MSLLRTSSLLTDIDHDSLDAESTELLVAHAQAFVQSGLSLDDWSRLTTVERAAVVETRKRRDTEQALLIAKALTQGGALELVSTLDGGKAETSSKLQDAIIRAASKAVRVS